MGDITREKTIEELEEELKAASEEYKRLSSIVKQRKDAERKREIKRSRLQRRIVKQLLKKC